MPRYLLSRVLYTLPVIWLVVSTVFLLIHFVPGDPIQQMLGEGAPAGDIQITRHSTSLSAGNTSTTGKASSTETSANPSASTSQ